MTDSRLVRAVSTQTAVDPPSRPRPSRRPLPDATPPSPRPPRTILPLQSPHRRTLPPDPSRLCRPAARVLPDKLLHRRSRGAPHGVEWQRAREGGIVERSNLASCGAHHARRRSPAGLQASAWLAPCFSLPPTSVPQRYSVSSSVRTSNSSGKSHTRCAEQAAVVPALAEVMERRTRERISLSPRGTLVRVRRARSIRPGLFGRRRVGGGRIGLILSRLREGEFGSHSTVQHP